MQVEYKVSNRCKVTVDGNTVKEIFGQIATLSEVFGVDRCGACDSDNVFPVARTVDKFTYYEMRCKECKARLSFGQSQDQANLYPRRQYHDDHKAVEAGAAKAGDWLPNSGWEVYKPDDNAKAVAAKPGKKGR